MGPGIAFGRRQSVIQSLIHCVGIKYARHLSQAPDHLIELGTIFPQPRDLGSIPTQLRVQCQQSGIQLIFK